MKGLVINRFALLGLVTLALLASFGVAWVTRPAAVPAAKAPGPPQMATVTSAIRACPAPGAGRVAVFAASPAGQGRAQFFAAPAAVAPAVTAPPLATLTTTGRLWVSRGGFATPKAPPTAAHKRRPAPRPGALIIDAAGSMARGLDAEQTAYSAVSAGSVPCAPPGTDFWFVGPTPAKNAGLDLYLADPDRQAAAVDVEMFTDMGPLQGNTDTGIAVPPGGSVVQSIVKFVKGSRIVGLHVRTSVGRVSAAVAEAGVWWRATTPPAGKVVIPGLPGTGTGRRLYLADPGGNDAQVHVQAITPAGSYQPAGSGGIEVPAGSVVAVDLPSLNGVPAALALTSSVPVTAAVAVGTRAFTAAAPPVQQQGVIADNMSGPGFTTAVVLSAPAGAAKARIFMAGSRGRLGAAKLVSVRAGHSANVVIALPRGAAGAFAIVISPVGGPLYAARVLVTRRWMIITPVLSDPVTVALPAISDVAGGAIP